MMRWRFVLLTMLLLASFPKTALAAGRVVLLQPTPSSLDDWPSATRAAIAELALAGFEVTVKKTRREKPERIIEELAAELREASVVAALFITRSPNIGTAYVWVRGASAPIQIAERSPDAPIAQSALALKLAEHLRQRSWQLPERTEDSSAPAELRQQPDHPLERALGLRAGVGATWCPGASAAGLVSVGLSLKQPSFPVIDLEGRYLLSTMSVASDAGRTTLRFAGATAHLWYDPHQASSLNATAGAALGLLRLRSRGIGNDDYASRADAATVGFIGIALGAGASTAGFRLQLIVEPGLLLPPVSFVSPDSPPVRFGVPLVNSLLMGTWDL